MYKNKKIIVVSPVGRRESMSLLFNNVLSQRSIVDEHHLWVNTNIKEDLDFIHLHASKYPNFVKLKHGCDALDPQQMGRADNVKRFYNYCVEKDTFYFKADDDIIYIEPGTFEKVSQFKIENPQVFLTYPTIINNHWCTHFLRKANKLKIPVCNTCENEWYSKFEQVKEIIRSHSSVMSNNINEPKPKDFGLENVALSELYWRDPIFAYHLLSSFADLVKSNQQSNLNISNVTLEGYEPVSINFIMWAGEDFAKFNGDVKSVGDEMWLNLFYPLQHGLKNVILGNTRVVHYSYYPQREFLNSTNILRLYEDSSLLQGAIKNPVQNI